MCIPILAETVLYYVYICIPRVYIYIYKCSNCVCLRVLGSTYGTNGFVLWTLGSFIFAFPSASFAVNSSFNSLPCACQSYFLTVLSLSLSPAVHPSFCLLSLTLSLRPSVLLPSSICLSPICLHSCCLERGTRVALPSLPLTPSILTRLEFPGVLAMFSFPPLPDLLPCLVSQANPLFEELFSGPKSPEAVTCPCSPALQLAMEDKDKLCVNTGVCTRLGLEPCMAG